MIEPKPRQQIVDAKTSGRKRRAREVETTEYLAMVLRMIRAAGRWVAEADEVELSELENLRGELDQIIVSVVDKWRAQGRSWATIGDALGLSRQGAQQRFARRTTGGTP